MSQNESANEMQPDLGRTKWEQIELLGKGEFGLVYKVRNSAFAGTPPPVYAAKISTGIGHSNDLLRREIDVHSRLVHPNIIQYINSFEILECGGKSIIQVAPGTVNLACVCMVIEIANGNLQEQFKPHKPPQAPTPLDIRFAKKWARDLVSALIYLKEQSILHRDIKLQNVLLVGGIAKLADFGFATLIENLPPLENRPRVGTPVYFAPEIINKNLYSYQSDVWALGCVIYAMVTGRLPFMANKMPALAQKIVAVNFAPLPEEYDSIGAFFNKDPIARIRIENVLALDFFTEYSTYRSPVRHGMSFEVFKAFKEEFGLGTRDAFYMYLANKFPEKPPMSLKEFSELYDRLYL